MPTYLESATVSISERGALLKAFPCFSFLASEQTEELALLLQELRYAPEEVVVRQDELVDSVYFIVQGEAEVTILAEPLAVLHAGDSIGLNDTGFFSASGKRTATVKANSELLLLVLSLKDLHHFLEKNKLESEMYAAAEKMLRIRLIKQSLPFSKLTHERLQWLSEKVENLSVPAGTVIFKQGEQGNKCYLIRSGKIEIASLEKDGSSHLLAVLKPPTLFGEATLVTQQPRNATARALEDSQLLILSFQYLNELWEKEHIVAEMFMTLMVDRSRPVRNPEVRDYTRNTADGQTIVILKNPDTASYFKLSQEGWFIWKQMNGQQTLLEITMALANQYQLFSPHLVVALISKLAHAGFVSNVNLGTLETEKKTTFEKWLFRLQRLLDFRIIFKKVDLWLTTFYQNGIKWLFTPIGQGLLAFLTLGGFIVFLLLENHIIHLFQMLHASWLIFVGMLPLTMLTAGLHELGHAFGTKAYGRQVHAMGVGWNWTRPIAFTDTTDMWLDTRGHRIVVNLAGLYTNVLMAGLSSLFILFVPSLYLQAFLWLFALTTYIKGFAMLNPAEDMDGYFILMDFFERPHLRQDATVWLIKKFPGLLKQPSLILKYGPEAGYWLCCLVFLVLTALITFYVQA
ncbi:MAG TPA: PqqD family peptide modification chaperone, partial [Gammaproteobacteria bacterium]|nr:PqqD family peptide modification chaperone [Gammaproteobacteria bacterium]